MSIRQKTNSTMAITLMVLGGFVLVICVPALFSNDAAAQFIGVLLSVSALLMFIGGYRTLRAIKLERMAEMVENHRLQLLQEDDDEPLDEVAESNQIIPKIYAAWHFDAQVWQLVSRHTLKKSLKEELYTAVWFPVLVPLLTIIHNFWIGIVIGLVLAALYLLFKMWYIKHHFTEIKTGLTAEILLTDHYVRINGKYIHFANGNYWLNSADIDEDFLHLQIAWVTSKNQSTSMDLYLPIPTGNATDAQLFIDAFKQANNIN